MCGSGETKINDNEISIYLGYYGASLTFGDKTYCIKGEYKQQTTKIEMIEHIKSKCNYDEFITGILEIIDNGSDE